MSLTGNQEAYELLLIEEADAWFEYLESTRGQSETRYARGRAVGVGAPGAAAARDRGAPREARAGVRGGVVGAGAAR